MLRADVDIVDGKPRLTIAGEHYSDFRAFLGAPRPGLQRCGLWIEGRRQYGLKVYRDGEWMFTIPHDRSYADRVYDMIDQEAE